MPIYKGLFPALYHSVLLKSTSYATDETSLTPIDLAVASKQEEILDILFDYCLCKYKNLYVDLTRIFFKTILIDKNIFKHIMYDFSQNT